VKEFCISRHIAGNRLITTYVIVLQADVYLHLLNLVHLWSQLLKKYEGWSFLNCSVYACWIMTPTWCVIQTSKVCCPNVQGICLALVIKMSLVQMVCHPNPWQPVYSYWCMVSCLSQWAYLTADNLQQSFRLYVRKFVFSKRVISNYNSLPAQYINCSTVNTFTNCISVALEQKQTWM